MVEEPSSRCGRPGALDATAREVVVALLTAGVSRAAAARYVGVSPQTVRNTANRDAVFAAQIDRAEASCFFQHARVISAASRQNWRASVWALERLVPDRFGDPDRRSLRRSQAKARLRLLAHSPDRIRRILDEELPNHVGLVAKQAIVDRLTAWCERLLSPDASSGSDPGGGAA